VLATRTLFHAHDPRAPPLTNVGHKSLSSTSCHILAKKEAAKPEAVVSRHFLYCLQPFLRPLLSTVLPGISNLYVD